MHEADYVLLLNSDSVVEKRFLEPAIGLAESDRKIGLVSGKIYLKDKPGYLWYAGGSFSLVRGMVIIRGWHQLDEGQFNCAEEQDVSTGALMLIKKEVLIKVGLLPEEYFFGQEEWDYSLTVRRAGYRLYYVPEFVSHHKGDGSHRNLDGKYLYCGYRNRLIFQEKFLPSPLFFLWKAVYVFYHEFLAERRLSRLGQDIFRTASLALRAALRDHDRTTPRMVTEEDLIAFERELKKTLARR
jgi:GT2 family glycosyltransferase